ncbi:MAG: NINE protein [Planctomycetota bacterium]|nr:NINE protein [Planctomycetota bacterium]
MRSTPIAYLLWFFFGLLGIHRFYLGRPISGVIYLLTGGVFLIGWIVDLFLIPGMVRMENLEWKVSTGQQR